MESGLSYAISRLQALEEELRKKQAVVDSCRRSEWTESEISPSLLASIEQIKQAIEWENKYIDAEVARQAAPDSIRKSKL